MSVAQLLPKTIRGQFALFAVSLALPLVAPIGYGLYDRTRDDIAASEAIARRLAESNLPLARHLIFLCRRKARLQDLRRQPLPEWNDG